MSAIGQDPIPLATPHPADGRALRYHVDDFMIGWLASMAGDLSQHANVRACAEVLDAGLLQMYLEQVLYLELINVGRDFHRRRFAQGKSSNLPPVECPANLLELVKRHWPDSRIVLCPGRPVHFRRPLAVLRGWARDKAWRITNRRPRVPVFNGSMVAVELVEGTTPTGKSDAFWLHNSAVDPARTLFVLERGNRVFVDLAQQTTEIARIGAHCVALHPSVSLKGKVRLWYPSAHPSWSRRLRYEMRGGNNPLERWLLEALCHCIDRVAYWEEFSQVHGIAVFQQFTEVSLETAVRRMALQKTGGVEIGKQRSQFFERSSAAFHFQHDVAFVWSRTAIPCLTHGRTRTLGHVVTGYVNDHLFESAKTEANILRRQLENVGVTMVVALYDNWPHPNGHFTSEHLVVFYETVLHMVHQHHDVGLIVKTKKRQLLSRFPSVQAKLMQLIGVGRCILLDGGLSTSIVPSALACDIAVGIPTSTAVCEAALAGCRVLMYDPGCARDHAWVVPNKQGIVHHELEAFSDALSSYLAARDKVTCGDVSNCIADIDPFRDGLAYRRAGDFIVGALKMKDSGKNPREHLEQLPHFESLASTNSARHRETTLTE